MAVLHDDAVLVVTLIVMVIVIVVSVFLFLFCFFEAYNAFVSTGKNHKVAQYCTRRMHKSNDLYFIFFSFAAMLSSSVGDCCTPSSGPLFALNPPYGTYA